MMIWNLFTLSLLWSREDKTTKDAVNFKPIQTLQLTVSEQTKSNNKSIHCSVNKTVIDAKTPSGASQPGAVLFTVWRFLFLNTGSKIQMTCECRNHLNPHFDSLKSLWIVVFSQPCLLLTRCSSSCGVVDNCVILTVVSQYWVKLWCPMGGWP